MQRVRRAALAPAQPSATDRSVAAQASQIEAQARMEMTKEKAEAAKENKAQQENALADTLPNLAGSSPTSSSIGRSIDVII